MDIRERARGYLRTVLNRLRYPEDVIRESFDLLFYEGKTRESRPFIFSVTEFSLSFYGNKKVIFRSLAEITTKRPFAHQDGQVIKSYLISLFLHFSGSQGLQYDVDLFEFVYNLIYDEANYLGKEKSFRFGLAFEYTDNLLPILKCYFDLSAVLDQGTVLQRIFDKLGMSREFSAYNGITGNGAIPCCGIGVDFNFKSRSSLKLYISGSSFALKEIEALCLRLDIELRDIKISDLSFLLLNGQSDSNSLKGNLVCLVFSKEFKNHLPVLKLDIFLPQHSIDDRNARLKIVRLAEKLKIDISQGTNIIDSLIENRNLQDLRNVHQYLSLDFIPGKTAKMNIYLRLPGLFSEHLNERFVPQIKNEYLANTDAVLTLGLNYINSERSNSYAEMTHKMSFPSEVFSNLKQSIFRGSLFQRTIVIDTLLELNKLGFFVDFDCVKDQVDHILGEKTKYGWKYFRDLTILPPDIDDLAQVIQVLHKFNYDDLANVLDTHINFAIKINEQTKGAFRTWICDAAMDNYRELRFYVNNFWGDEPDVEVIANFIFALHIYEPQRYKESIEQGLEYIVNHIGTDGSWASTWYCGQYYGTYMCVRAIATLVPNHPIFHKVLDFMLKSQSADGGWGVGGSNPNDTAFALLILNWIKIRNNENEMRRACQFLIDKQLQNGSWAATNFIKMNTNRVNKTEKELSKYIYYGSDMITTCLCLQAICKYRSTL